MNVAGGSAFSWSSGACLSRRSGGIALGFLLVLLGLASCQRPQASGDTMEPKGVGESLALESALPTEQDQAVKEAKMASPMDALRGSALMTSDERTRALLEARDHHPDWPLPRALFRLMSEREVARGSLHVGLHWRDAKLELSWFCSDTGVLGRVDEVEAYLDALMAELGFLSEPSDAEFLPLMWVQQSDDLVELMRREPAQGWKGGKRATAGLTLLFLLQAKAAAEPPSLAAALKAFPFLRDQRLDDALFERCAEWPLVEASQGGTRSKYHSTTLGFASQEGLQTHATLRALLLELGFVEDGAPRSDYVSYRRDSTGSFAQLYAPAEDGVVSLHWQPES